MYKLYVAQNGNIKMVENYIKKEGKYKTDKYEGAILRHNIRNLYMIGLYRTYKAAMRRGTRPCSGWQTFTTKYEPVLKKL